MNLKKVFVPFAIRHNLFFKIKLNTKVRSGLKPHLTTKRADADVWSSYSIMYFWESNGG